MAGLFAPRLEPWQEQARPTCGHVAVIDTDMNFCNRVQALTAQNSVGLLPEIFDLHLQKLLTQLARKLESALVLEVFLATKIPCLPTRTTPRRQPLVDASGVEATGNKVYHKGLKHLEAMCP